MSNLEVGSSGIGLVTDHGIGPTYPAWQPGRKISISKSVNGNIATFTAGVPPSEAATPVLNANQVDDFIWQNVQFCHAPSSGVGWGTEVYISDTVAQTSRHDYNAVESGKLGEIPPVFGTPNLIGQALLDGSGERMRRIVKPAFWLSPGQETTPGFPAKNNREVSDFIMTMDYTWGAYGDSHIILIDLSIVIPVDSYVQSKTLLSVVPFFYYSPDYNVVGRTAKPFNTQKWIDIATGAVSNYTAGEIRTDKVLENRSADGNFAIAAVYGNGSLADSGSLGQGYKGFASSGTFVNAYGFCAKSYPNGIPAGVINIPIAVCVGTESDVSAAIPIAYSNLPMASYPS